MFKGLLTFCLLRGILNGLNQAANRVLGTVAAAAASAQVTPFRQWPAASGTATTRWCAQWCPLLASTTIDEAIP